MSPRSGQTLLGMLLAVAILGALWVTSGPIWKLARYFDPAAKMKYGEVERPGFCERAPLKTFPPVVGKFQRTLERWGDRKLSPEERAETRARLQRELDLPGSSAWRLFTIELADWERRYLSVFRGGSALISGGLVVRLEDGTDAYFQLRNDGTSKVNRAERDRSRLIGPYLWPCGEKNTDRVVLFEVPAEAFRERELAGQLRVKSVLVDGEPWKSEIDLVACRLHLGANVNLVRRAERCFQGKLFPPQGAPLEVGYETVKDQFETKHIVPRIGDVRLLALKAGH